MPSTIEQQLEPEVIQKLLHTIETASPTLNQRTLAQELCCSLGRVNYILNALIEKGLVKANNFHKSQDKLKYRYLLTPEGAKEKLRLTRQLVERKRMEYEELCRQLEQAEDKQDTLF
ncbi:MarR family EPS-associated transcriptional regulator [Chrysiogenes arsenatis]|uniref:MarR family EPS-associated transcriptional regulator n=1 Tax=Chrysiogenes arsenatis TaxID=309797 RepID=UPI0003F613CA|nr:MarR family EPS-associated transcriptional regulator [Chrysiogenes arsenatis]